MFFKKKAEERPALIYQHLGLGDYIILSGGLKYLKRKGFLKQTFCICKHQYLNSVKQLYADVEGFEIIGVNDWKAAEILVRQWKGEKMIIGFDKMVDWSHFDLDFYRIIGVDFNERWDSFTIERNLEAENELLDQINLPENFVFVHDDQSRGYRISNEYFAKDLPVIRPHLTNSIFDWIPVLERATEIHCMCSSFKHLTDSLPNIKSVLYYHHSYVNNGVARETSISASKKKWQII